MIKDPMRELPMGLGMALMQHPDAMQRFSAMTQQQQQQIIEHTKTITSKQEMKQYVSSLVSPSQGEYRGTI